MSAHRFIKLLAPGGIVTSMGYVASGAGHHVIRVPDTPDNRLAMVAGIRVVDDYLQPYTVRSVAPSPCRQWIVARCDSMAVQHSLSETPRAGR